MKNIRYYIFWVLDFLRGSEIKKQYIDIKNIMNKDDMDCWQEKKIGHLITYASQNCPYYKKYRNYKTIKECPVINKNDIKDHYEDIISKQYKDQKDNLHKMSTSGSTGTPFVILQNKEKRNRVIAELIYFNEIIGQNLGDKFIFYRVWTEKNRKSRLEQIKQNLLPIDILRLDDKTLQNIISILQKDKKIKSTLAYASTYDMILHYIKKNQISGQFNVKAMVSSSELLTDETRDGIEQNIGCKVINRYSNQECGVLAQSDLQHRKLRINKACYYIELLSMEADTPVQPGEMGRIVVTDLFNNAMPLIRYDTGDLGVLSSDGKSFEYISGRKVDLIYDTKGNPLTPHTWSVYMWKYDQLKQYQFIQEGEKEYILKVNGAKGIYTAEELDQTLRAILGNDAQIRIEFVDSIPVLSSGKFKKTICNYVLDKA